MNWYRRARSWFKREPPQEEVPSGLRASEAGKSEVRGEGVRDADEPSAEYFVNLSDLPTEVIVTRFGPYT